MESGLNSEYKQVFCRFRKYDKRIEENFAIFSVKSQLGIFCSVFNDNTLQKGLPWPFKLGPL